MLSFGKGFDAVLCLYLLAEIPGATRAIELGVKNIFLDSTAKMCHSQSRSKKKKLAQILNYFLSFTHPWNIYVWAQEINKIFSKQKPTTLKCGSIYFSWQIILWTSKVQPEQNPPQQSCWLWKELLGTAVEHISDI